MSSHEGIDRDGIPSDGESYESATAHLAVYAESRLRLQSFSEPVLVHANNGHERLYVAAFDGTRNDKIHDAGHETNVGLISDQIERLKLAGNPQIAGDYVAGTGTEQHHPFARLADGMRGYTVEERAEELYRLFIEQAWKWKQQDADALIRVAAVGFSRGGGRSRSIRAPCG